MNAEDEKVRPEEGADEPSGEPQGAGVSDQETETAADPSAPVEEDWREMYLRVQADLQNMRKRMDQDVEARVQLRMEALLHDLIRVADYMEAALGSVPQAVREAKQADSFLAGMEAIRHALESVMQGHGMVFLAPGPDQAFDPDEHEAVETLSDDTLESPRLELLNRGYRIGRRILRPAQVRLLQPGDGK